MPYKTKEAQAEYRRQYWEKNKERLTEYRRAWLDRNREKVTANQRARYKADPEKYRKYFRDHRIKKVYRLTELEYSRLVSEQDGKCGICGKPPSGTWHGDRMLNVDHDHQTGAVRGLLCNKCNRGLGILGDTVERITAVLKYLERKGTHAGRPE